MNRKRIFIFVIMLLLIAAMTLFWSGGSLSRYSADVASATSSPAFVMSIDLLYWDVRL